MPFQLLHQLRLSITGIFRRLSAPTMEPVRASSIVTYASERQFEDQVILPLLTQWGVRVQRQVPCRLRSRTGVSAGRIDMLVYTNTRATRLTLFENKRRMRTPMEQARAVAQANAYARACRLLTFVIAAPEGLWVYSRPGGQPALEAVFTPEDIRAGAHDAYALLLCVNQPKRWRMRHHAAEHASALS